MSAPDAIVRRLPNWERLLGEFLASIVSEPTPPGLDGLQLAFGAVEAQRGIHPAPEFVGAEIEDESDLIDILDGLFVPCPPGFARRGDLIMAHGEVGICAAGLGLFLTDDEGLLRVPRADFTHAWRV